MEMNLSIKEYKREYYQKNKEHIKQCQYEYREIRKQAGLCSRCGQNIIDYSRSFSHCENCLEKKRNYNNKRNFVLQSSGICVSCGKQPIDYLRNKYFCTQCADRRAYLHRKRIGDSSDFMHELQLAAQSLQNEKRR